MTYTDKQIRAFLREVKLEAWAESTPHIRGVGKLLEALREPTPGHVNGAKQKISGFPRPETIVAIHRAMLDARMGEG